MFVLVKRQTLESDVGSNPGSDRFKAWYEYVKFIQSPFVDKTFTRVEVQVIVELVEILAKHYLGHKTT
jgi:hypothetical protein